MKDIYRGKVIHPNREFPEKVIYLGELSHIFNCPNCEYYWTALDELGVKVTRDLHNMTHHPDIHLEVLHLDAQDNLSHWYEDLFERSYLRIPVGD